MATDAQAGNANSIATTDDLRPGRRWHASDGLRQVALAAAEAIAEWQIRPLAEGLTWALSLASARAGLAQVASGKAGAMKAEAQREGASALRRLAGHMRATDPAASLRAQELAMVLDEQGRGPHAFPADVPCVVSVEADLAELAFGPPSHGGTVFMGGPKIRRIVAEGVTPTHQRGLFALAIVEPNRQSWFARMGSDGKPEWASSGHPDVPLRQSLMTWWHGAELRNLDVEEGCVHLILSAEPDPCNEAGILLVPSLGGD